jgi:ketosteroid isomerase-like protein
MMNTAREDVLEVLARYGRAVDARDATTVASLFTEDGREILRHDGVGTANIAAEFVGRDQIAAAARDVVGPLPPRVATHHTTHDHIVRIDGDTATIAAHFMVHQVRGAMPPDAGWPSGASGGQGEIVLSEMGHYQVALIRSAGTWHIALNEVTLDLPLPLAPEPV